jgi:hypothetical protein
MLWYEVYKKLTIFASLWIFRSTQFTGTSLARCLFALIIFIYYASWTAGVV